MTLGLTSVTSVLFQTSLHVFQVLNYAAGVATGLGAASVHSSVSLDDCIIRGLYPASLHNDIVRLFFLHCKQLLSQNMSLCKDCVKGVVHEGIAEGKFGGLYYVFDLAHLVDAAVAFHPSLIKVPDDLEKYISIAKTPLLINSCTNDEALPLVGQIKADEILGGGKYEPGYERKHWEGVTHGFTVCGDLGDPIVKAANEGAFDAALQWFFKYL